MTNAAWKLLDSHLSLQNRLADGESVAISAETIKAVTKREPRLMTKFDSRIQRPPTLSNATILPVRNGEYVILPGDGYHEVEDLPTSDLWTLPDSAKKLTSLPWKSGPSSESQLLDMTYSSGLLNEFLEEPEQYLTVRGRLRSPDFEFRFQTSFGIELVHVSGVQVEVDAGYEGTSLNLVEAKLGKRDDFHIRQLYYPVRMWQERLPAKPARAVFITYSDRVTSLRLYDFSPADYYGGLVLTKAADYVLDDQEFRIDLHEILANTRPGLAPEGVTFPQADDMAKVLDVVDATAAGVTDTNEIMERYGFASRQAVYYPTAARYLGLLERSGTERRLTEVGHVFSTAPRKFRHKLVLERLAALSVFRFALEYAIANQGQLPQAEAIADRISSESIQAGLPLGGTTLLRRAATVRSWTQWALNVVDE